MSAPLLPSPQTTLVIILGASKWPFSPDLPSSEAFSNAAKRFREYLLSSSYFSLPHENLLDLFDSDQSAEDIDIEMRKFLQKRMDSMKKLGNEARDILFYFVGHGGFTSKDQKFFLAIRRTRNENPRYSAIMMDGLADTLLDTVCHLRQIIILDCCFAGAAFKSYQSNPLELAAEKTKSIFNIDMVGKGFPYKGVSLFCSSEHTEASQLLPDNSAPTFTDAFLLALHEGDARRIGNSTQDKYLTLRDVKDMTNLNIRNLYTTKAPKAVIHSPNQSEGDIADVPFFPNFAGQREREKKLQKLPGVLELVAKLPANQLAFTCGIDSQGKAITRTLPEMGHILLAGGSMGKTNLVQLICAQLCAKNSPLALEIMVFDLASHQEDYQVISSEFPHFKILETDKYKIGQHLLMLQKELARRQKQISEKDPAILVVIENFTSIFLKKYYWDAIMDLLYQGVKKKIFVIATMRYHGLETEIKNLFPSTITFGLDSEQHILIDKATSLNLPPNEPIFHFWIKQYKDKASTLCSMCKQNQARFLYENYLSFKNKKENELVIAESAYDADVWWRTVIEQLENGIFPHYTYLFCPECTIHAIDLFSGEGTGLSLMNEAFLLPKEVYQKISFVGYKQFGQENICVISRVMNESTDEVIGELKEGSLVQPNKCPTCYSALKKCSMCQQLKCFDCMDKTFALLNICQACWEDYQASVVVHLLETLTNPEETKEKGWCEVCNDWMLVSHEHKSPKRWLDFTDK